MTITIVVVVAVIGVGLAASQLVRLKSYLNKPPPDVPPGDDSD